MRIFGLEIRRAPPLSPVRDNRGGWSPYIREPFTGAWQRNMEWTVDSVLAHPTVFSCVNLIASDVAKMRTKLVQEIAPDLWVETTSPAFSPVLRRPNRFQNQVQFKKNWITSKLTSGNAYILKERDVRRVVVALYVLDPNRVKVLVAPDGEVFYELKTDHLAGLPEDIVVPSSEIIHDRMNPIFHPLVGVSPLFAAGGPADMGLRIQQDSSGFFANGSSLSGILSAPQSITAQKAKELTELWKSYQPGDMAVVGDGMKFEQLRMSATDSQTIGQLGWTADSVCAAYRVPAFMVNAGPAPSASNAEMLVRLYYSTCLHEQKLDVETALDHGLNLIDEKKDGKQLGIELDRDALLEMDSATQMDTLVKGVRGGVLTPNGARRRLDELPLEGGDTIYLQHQDYPIEKVFNRNDLDKPAAPPALPPSEDPDEPEEEPANDEEADDEAERTLADLLNVGALTLRIAA